MGKKPYNPPAPEVYISLEAKIVQLEKEIKAINNRISGLKPVKIPEGVKEVGTFKAILEDLKNKLQLANKRITQLEKLPPPPTKEIKPENFKRFEEDVYKQFESISRSIKDILAKSKEKAEKAEAEIRMLKESVEEAKRLEEDVKKMNVESIMRDLEILKTRNQWLEGQIEKIGTGPLHERVQELEHKINTLKASSALIIE